MKFELPFDKKIYLLQTELGIPIIQSELIRRRRNSLISGLIFTLLGTAILFGKGDIGVIFVIIGVISFFDSYLKNQKYTEFKSNIMSVTRNHLKNNKPIPKLGVFDFNDDYVIYMDEIMCSKTRWAEFEDYKLVKSNLFLIRKKVDGDMIVLGKSEIGEMNFKKLIELIKSKMNRKNILSISFLVSFSLVSCNNSVKINDEFKIEYMEAFSSMSLTNEHQGFVSNVTEAYWNKDSLVVSGNKGCFLIEFGKTKYNDEMTKIDCSNLNNKLKTDPLKKYIKN